MSETSRPNPQPSALPDWRAGVARRRKRRWWDRVVLPIGITTLLLFAKFGKAEPLGLLESTAPPFVASTPAMVDADQRETVRRLWGPDRAEEAPSVGEERRTEEILRELPTVLLEAYEALPEFERGSAQIMIASLSSLPEDEATHRHLSEQVDAILRRCRHAARLRLERSSSR